MELHIIGELVGAADFPQPELFCKWEVSAGDGWQLLEGEASGQTQADCPEEGDTAIWCHPVDLHYSTTSVAGWPRMKLEVWHHDAYGRNELYSYGFCHIPTSPGTHEMKCATWRPKGTLVEEISAFFVGGGVQLSNESTVGSGTDRYRLKTVSMGTVLLNFTILVKDNSPHGVHL